MPEEASVPIDSMSGFDFEELVADILARLGYGQVERILFTQDEGRDILLRSQQGLIVVECKHQPNTGIGRPIVQKLHSAVIASNAAKGMLVTTGHFTGEALEYARKLADSGTTIEMVDKRILADLAMRAKIRLVSGGEGLNVWTWAVPPQADTKKAVGEYLQSVVESHPRIPSSLIANDRRSVWYQPLYHVIYDVNAIFETSVGVIHQESVNGASLVLDGNTGQVHGSKQIQFLHSEPQVLLATSIAVSPNDLPTFKIDATTLLKTARNTIIAAHTKTVRYRGRNNQTYSRVCEPGEREVHIRDVRQVHLPSLKIDFQILQTPYQMEAVHAQSGRFLTVSTDVTHCRVCRLAIEKKAILCDVCGRVTHSGGFFLGRIHGFRCGRCRRTTCRVDGQWRRRMLLFKELLCPTCAQTAKSEGRRMNKFEPL